MAEPTSTWVTGSPAPPLRPLVDAYLGYRMAGHPPGLHRGLPSRHLTFIVSLDEPIEVVDRRDPGRTEERFGLVVGGLDDTWSLIAHGGRQEGVAVELTPLGCRRLLGLPAAALWKTSVEGTDVLGRLAVELRERLHEVTGWRERFAVCDDVLGRLLSHRGRPGSGGRGDTPVAPEVREAWRLLVGSGGTVAVADVAAHVGWSRRHLSQRFGAELGLSPKTAARIVRFERACRLLRAPGRSTIADVAAACGYYDQAHLDRDFADLAGCPPTEWLATEIPSFQDTEALEGAGSPHD